jgi:hypothetical protein
VYEALAAGGIGVLAVAVATLQEMAFINLLIPVAPGRVRAGREPTVDTYTLEDGMAELAEDCAVARSAAGSGDRDAAEYGTRATDYPLVRSGPVSLTRPADARPVRPVWLVWELSEWVPDSRQPVLRALEYLRGEAAVEECHLEYCRARRTPSGRVRGRAKLGLTLRQEDDGTPDRLEDLCVRAQAHALGEMVPTAELLLRIAWRERWLGNWKVPPL